jgi:hypothetical protein
MRKIYAIVRIFYKVKPETLPWEELLEKYGDATYAMQMQADMISHSVIRDLAKATNTD